MQRFRKKIATPLGTANVRATKRAVKYPSHLRTWRILPLSTSISCKIFNVASILAVISPLVACCAGFFGEIQLGNRMTQFHSSRLCKSIFLLLSVEVNWGKAHRLRDRLCRNHRLWMNLTELSALSLHFQIKLVIWINLLPHYKRHRSRQSLVIICTMFFPI